MSRALNVAIIGIGPAGLAAALAVRNNGGYAHMFSKSLAKSPLYGCQYLHMPLPGPIDIPHTSVSYELRGDPDGYRAKVYGNSWNGQVSAEDYIGDHEAWDLRETYQRLYDAFLRKDDEGTSFTPFRMSPERLREIADEMRDHFDLTISTAPVINLCARPTEHTFTSQQVYAAGDAPKLGMYCPIDVPDDTVICNGNSNPSWYRASRVFGHSTVEWPNGPQPPYLDVVPISKPLWTDCDCFPWIERLGRFGSWRKEILVHDVYEQAQLIYRAKSHMAMMTPRRSDFCIRCGRISHTTRPVLDSGNTEYRCLDGHVWEYRT